MRSTASSTAGATWSPGGASSCAANAAAVQPPLFELIDDCEPLLFDR
jgi:hypothetical protein